MRLDEDAARLVAPSGAAGDLLNLLKAALRRPQVAPRKAEVRIDHADERKVGEMVALGHQLRADDHIDGAGFHRADEFSSAKRRPYRVGRNDGGAGLREQL